MSKDVLYALHEVHHDNGVAVPGALFPVNENQAAELLAVGAARELTAEEWSIWALQNGDTVGAVDEAAAAEAAAAEAAAARAALETEAEELGVKFNANLSDQKLLERVMAAREAAVAATPTNDPDETAAIDI